MIWRIIRWKKEGWAAVKQRRKIKAEAIGVHSRKDRLCMCVSVCYTIFKDIWQLTESPLTPEVIKELLNSQEQTLGFIWSTSPQSCSPNKLHFVMLTYFLAIFIMLLIEQI